MTTATTTTTSNAGLSDEAALRACIDTAARHRFGPTADVVDVTRRRSANASSYHAEIIDVGLRGGQSMKLFLKNYGSYRNPKEQMRDRRERELRVFRDLLPANGEIGTPRYCGCVWDEARGWYWLLLEFVEAVQLRDLEYEHWVTALGWLGTLHAHFRTRQAQLAHSTFLMRHDDAFFHATAALARDVVAKLSPVMATRLSDVLRDYGRLVRIMTDQPTTLVHGAYRPPNVMVVFDEAAPPRICAIDWEEAAIGSPLYDVAYLSDGFEPPRLDEVWGAYRHEAERGGVYVAPRDEMRRVTDSFRVHKLLNLLGKSIHRNYPPDSVEKMIGMADALSRSIG